MSEIFYGLLLLRKKMGAVVFACPRTGKVLNSKAALAMLRLFLFFASGFFAPYFGENRK